MRGKKLLAVLAVLVLLVAALPLAGVTGFPGRARAGTQVVPLKSQEQEAAETLLSLGEQVNALETAQSRIEAELPAEDAAVTRAHAQLTASTALLAVDQQRLGLWLNFLYRYGEVSLVTEVLEAKSWSDFESRLVLVTELMENQALLWQQARSQEAVCVRELATVHQFQIALQQKEDDLSTAIDALEKKRQAKENFLSSLERQSASLAQQVVTEETGWVNTLQPLSTVLGNLSNLPWDSLTPDNVSFGVDGVTARFDDATLTRVLDYDQSAANLQLTANDSGVVISGSENGVSFDLSAALVVSGPRQVRLVPKQLDLAGLPVQEDTLAAVTGGDLVFNLPEQDPQWKLSSISTGAGYVDFVFGP